MKPHCLADIGAFALKNSSKIAMIHFHLDTVLSLCSQLLANSLNATSLVPLGIGVILPIFQSVGSEPVDIEWLNSLCSGSAMLRDVH